MQHCNLYNDEHLINELVCWQSPMVVYIRVHCPSKFTRVKQSAILWEILILPMSVWIKNELDIQWFAHQDCPTAIKPELHKFWGALFKLISMQDKLFRFTIIYSLLRRVQTAHLRKRSKINNYLLMPTLQSMDQPDEKHLQRDN